MTVVTIRERKKINKHIRLFIDSQLTSKDGKITLQTLRHHLKAHNVKASSDTYINERLYYLGYRSFTNVKRDEWNNNLYFKKDTVLTFLESDLEAYPEYKDDITNLIEEFCIQSIRIYSFEGTSINSTTPTKFHYETHIKLYDDCYMDCILNKIKNSTAYNNVINYYIVNKTIVICTRDEETAVELRDKLFSTLLNSLWYSFKNNEKKISTKIPFNLQYPCEVNTSYTSARERFLDFLVDLHRTI